MDDNFRLEIEDAVIRALKAGASAKDVKAEVDYVIESYEAG